ncbi:MAG: LmbE family N-acetylglucosaminyl deacetylase [Bradymonadia bacterium]|jgi:LmbE family N-acetylglucosaminyl deacetylase
MSTLSAFSLFAMIAALLNPRPQPNGSELARDLERLQETARVLYVAAHPDDENTQLLGFMANDRGWRAAYLSLTRGEGGQNAIGDELVHGLGLIRTWELLTARGSDGAEQWMSRQRDFGYSKSAEETLNVWGEEESLGDVVWVIRSYRPDVVVTRFPETGSTHGHHLASAQLARRAFALAGDHSAYPDQLEGPDAVEPWQPTRLLYNVPLRWMGGEIQPEWYTVDLGAYDPLLGLSYGELAAQSRSLHRSQAFGSASRRGEDVEAFELLEGTTPADEDPFADIQSGWQFIDGGDDIAEHLNDALDAFDVRNPTTSIDSMLRAYRAADDLPEAHQQRVQADIATWVAAAAGIWIDARVDEPFVTPGQDVPVTIQVASRLGDGWSIDAIALNNQPVSNETIPLAANALYEHAATLSIPEDARIGVPYWMRETPTTGAYTVGDRALVGQPIDVSDASATLRLSLDGAPRNTDISITVPVRAVRVNATLGERVEPLTIVPPVFVAPASPVVLAPNGEPTTVNIDVEATTSGDATIRLDVPNGWAASPPIDVTLTAGERRTLDFTITPESATSAPATIHIVARANGRDHSWARQLIDYPHLPPLHLIQQATVAVTPLEWTPPTGTVGYIMGPGDAVADSLSAAGVSIQMLDDSTLATADLSAYQAILVGVRAFHTSEALQDHADRLWDYAEQGGTVVVQYQTNNRSQQLTQDVGPSAITIGRGRVTVEDAPMTWLPAATALTSGLHTLTPADTEGWVQERGLYFAESWDPAWTPLLSTADPGATEELGALLHHPHGTGHVFYLGLSLFRQLPAGVPGAYRLLANLIAFGE